MSAAASAEALGLAEGLGHAVQAQLVELIEGGMGEHGSPQW